MISYLSYLSGSRSLQTYSINQFIDILILFAENVEQFGNNLNATHPTLSFHPILRKPVFLYKMDKYEKELGDQTRKNATSLHKLNLIYLSSKLCKYSNVWLCSSYFGALLTSSFPPHLLSLDLFISRNISAPSFLPGVRLYTDNIIMIIHF